MYNYTAMNNITNILELTQTVNTHFMNGLFGILLLLAIGFILCSSFYWSTRDIKNSILATSFILFLMGLLMSAVNLIDGVTLLALFAGCAIAAAFTWQR